MTGLEDITKSRLSALILMSRNNIAGVQYLDFIKQGNNIGAIDLLDKGYAVKIINQYDKNDVSYKLTEKGIDYLKNLMTFAENNFK